MKYLILAAIIGLLLALLVRRLLPYLRMAQGFVKALQQLRSGAATPGSSSPRAHPAQEKLVRCSACGTWVPATRAIGGGSATQLFCSDACRRQGGIKARHHAAM